VFFVPWLRATATIGSVAPPLTHFAHCPRCGAQQPDDDPPDAGAPFRCASCRFTLYFNAASAVAAILVRTDGNALFIRRAKDPGKGRLGMPGGFVDAGESAEGALIREIREEVGLDVAGLRYLSSHPNQYAYAGVTYPTLDLFYTAPVSDPQRAVALDAVESVVWADPVTVDLEEIAFDSMRQALLRYRELS
jgi:ADP-ribose pyrophosphatase YjhB (NUDIX family)